MTLPVNKYNPKDTETFKKFFGSPRIHEPLNPIKCFFSDILNVGLSFRLIHLILSYFVTERPVDELYIWAPTFLSLIYFSICSLIQAIFVLPLLAIGLVTLAIFMVIITIHDILIWRIIQGPQLQVYPPTPPRHHRPRQRWIYINGIATGKTITHQNLQCLSETFHQPVLAVNNRTYGFLGDIFECIVQRAFGYRSKESGIATDIVKTWLQDDANVDRVVLIAHSQGGIFASQILDDLYCDVSADELGKLEVYTFGSAALTFHNPFKDKTHTARVVPVVEHYCNERDMVTSWGALSSTDRTDLPFVGSVFVFEGQTGHMLNQHYLKHMFTGGADKTDWDDDCYLLRAAWREGGTSENKRYLVKGHKADKANGEDTVADVSQLWRYMDPTQVL